MEMVNLIIAVTGLVIAAIGGIYIPLRFHRDAQKRNEDH